MLLGNGDGTFQPQVTYAVGRHPDTIVAGDFNGDGHLDLAVAGGVLSIDNTDEGEVSVLLGNGDGTFQAPVNAHLTARSESPSWSIVARATSPANGRLDLAVVHAESTARLDAAGQRRRHVPARGHLRGGVEPIRHRGGRLQRRRPRRPSLSTTVPPTTSPCCWATAMARSSTSGQFATTPIATPLVADVNGDGTDDVLVVDGAGNILYRQGIPGRPGTFEPPVTVNPRCRR